MTQPQPLYLVHGGTRSILPHPFSAGVTAPHPPAHCQCTWTWTPAIGGKAEPFALKFRNSACPVRHP